MDLRQDFEHINTLIDRESEELSTEAFEQQLTPLLETLGSKDNTLRDDLAWRTFHRLFRSDLISAHARIPLIETLMSYDFMFCGIEDGASIKTVKRSFSMLTLADLIWGDRDNSRLVSGVLLGQLSDELRRYVELERDFRGYDDQIGWVHCMAHAGDLFLALDQHPNTDTFHRVENVAKILTWIETREFEVFEWDEHMRLARPIASCLLSIGGKQVLSRFFGRYSVEALLSAPYRQNLLNTLRCVCLEMSWEGGGPPETQTQLKAILQ